MKIFNFRSLLLLACVCCFFVGKAQNNTKGVIVTMQFLAEQPNMPIFSQTDTFLVRNNYVLEPIKVKFFNQKTNLKTGISKGISAGKRLQSYNFFNYLELIGMNFDIEQKISAKTIETFRLSDGNKLGNRFIAEPYLSNGFKAVDFVKDRDTIINGARCFLIKNKVIPTVKGREKDKIFQFQIAIDPALKSCAFPFVSEKIVREFGGGAIVYAVGLTEKGSKTVVRYTYSTFTPVETKLFDHYQAMYEANVTLLDRLKKEK